MFGEVGSERGIHILGVVMQKKLERYGLGVRRGEAWAPEHPVAPGNQGYGSSIGATRIGGLNSGFTSCRSPNWPLRSRHGFMPHQLPSSIIVTYVETWKNHGIETTAWNPFLWDFNLWARPLTCNEEDFAQRRSGIDFRHLDMHTAGILLDPSFSNLGSFDLFWPWIGCQTWRSDMAWYGYKSMSQKKPGTLDTPR